MSAFELDFSGETAGKKFTVYTADGEGHEITLAGGDADAIAQDAVTKLQGFGLNAELDGQKVKVSSTDGSDISWTNGAQADGGNAMTYKTGSAVEVKLTGTGNGANSATIAAALNDAGVTGLTAEADGKKVAITAKGMEFRVFGKTEADVATLEEVGLSGSKKAGDPTEITQERVDYAKQFNEILSQIDSLAKDAGYKGINLLQENDLTVIFNEDRSSKIEVKGVDASSEGLGLAEVKNDWQKDADIDASISQVENAISKLRTMASDFGNNYSIVQTREEFTDNLINVLTEGADNLTLADMNEESANMLALQTRQQLAINSLSLASQASQSVLQLF